MLLYKIINQDKLADATESSKSIHLKKAFKQNWKLYLAEALGLAIFMISACFFSAMLEGDTAWHKALPNSFIRTIIMGLSMGLTALTIFYSPFTSSSGAHINPAVTITFFRLKKIKKWDAFFYILFQIIGGTLAVYGTAWFIKDAMIKPPVNYAATVPSGGLVKSLLVEFIIAFIMMTMVLFTSSHCQLKKYTSLTAGCFVCLFVIVAGPISGFGMNPARSLASAIPSGIWTAFWIYALVPIAGMLLAAETFLFVQKKKPRNRGRRVLEQYLKRQRLEHLKN